MIVPAKLVSTEGPYLEAKFLVDGVVYSAMDCLSETSKRKIAAGEELLVDFQAGLTDEQESWESIFDGNSDKKETLEALKGWQYRVYGRIVSLGPVLVKCGAWTFEAPFSTHDLKVVGEYVAFTITRLDASLAE